ncbi:MAG: hypothetical protein WCJ92_08385, partial [Alphaproteobacteria bacterium]
MTLSAGTVVVGTDNEVADVVGDDDDVVDDATTLVGGDGTGATVDLNTIDAYGRFIDCNEISVAPKTVKVNVDV